MLVSLSARTRRNTLRLRAANKHRLALIRNFSLKRREGNFGANPPSHEATADVDSVPSASSGQASPPHLPCKRGIRLRTRLRRTGFASLKILRPVRESEPQRAQRTQRRKSFLDADFADLRCFFVCFVFLAQTQLDVNIIRNQAFVCWS